MEYSQEDIIGDHSPTANGASEAIEEAPQLTKPLTPRTLFGSSAPPSKDLEPVVISEAPKPEEEENPAENLVIDEPNEELEAKDDGVEPSEEMPEPKADSPLKTTRGRRKSAELKKSDEVPTSSGRILRSRQSISTNQTPKESAKKASVTSIKRNDRKSKVNIEEEEEEKLPETIKVKGRRSTASTKKVEDDEKSDEEEKVPETIKVHGRRSAVSTKKVEDEEEAPRSRRSAAVAAQKNLHKTVETPKTVPRVSAKKQTTSPKSQNKRQSDIVINLDKDDPFNFDAQAFNHPEPLTSFKLQKRSFGEMKFTRSPITSTKNAEERYARTEKAVTKPAFINFPSLLSPTIKPASITALTTTPDVQRSVKNSASKSGRKRTQNSEDMFDDIAENGENKKSTQRKKRKSSPVSKRPQKAEIELPELGDADQLAVDSTNEPHPPGTRVFSLWGNEFYPSIVYDRDGLGRYKVFYVQDEAHREIPLTGIIPLFNLNVGHEVSVTTEKDGEELMKVVRITRVPSKSDPTEWVEGIYEVEDVDDEENDQAIEKYTWKQLFIGKNQNKGIIGDVKNQAVVIDTVNAVPRSTRRSRLSAIDFADLSRSGTTSRKKKANDENKEVSETPKKRGRKVKTPAKKSTPSSAKRSVSHESDALSVENQNGHEEHPQQLFAGCYFMLTSSARRPNATEFNKREFKRLVEELGGVVAEDISELQEAQGGKAFLIADTYYRTHKYLYALAASIPCLHFSYLTTCANSKELVDYEPFLLKAGRSVVNDEEYEWKPLKDELFKDKIIFVHSGHHSPSPNTVQFVQVWTPLLETLGATVIKCDSTDVEEVVNFCSQENFDFVLTDRNCYPEVLACVEEREIPAVSSNWIIHAIITGELVSVDTHPSFSPHE